MDRLEAARRESVTPPKSCFEEAQRKIAKGDYEFAVGQSRRGAG